MNKKLEIIKLLLRTQPLTASILSNQLGVSIRSIKNYIYSINSEYPNTITSSYDGYRINSLLAQQILKTYEYSKIPQTSQERVMYILNKILKLKDYEDINVYDLSEDLFVSTSTIKNEIKKVNSHLRKFDLELNSRGDFIKINGLEKNKRKMLSSLLYEESQNNFINLTSLQEFFTDIDISFIKNTVLLVFKEHQYFINDYSLSNLVLHIALSIQRIRDQNLSIDMSSIYETTSPEYIITSQIANQLENYFHIQFTHGEVYEMSLLITSRATSLNYEQINENNLIQCVGHDCLELVYTLIDKMKTLYSIDLSEQEFLIRFALHIRNLLVRASHNYLSKNPLTEEIKRTCPLIYDMAVNLTKTIIEETDIKINEDEIAFIAFHIGSILETKKDLSSKISTIIFCPSYYDFNTKLTDMINEYFSKDIIITNILTHMNDIEHIENNDLIISTVPLNITTSIPIFQINIFLTDKNRIELETKINEIKKDQQREELKNYLHELIIPDFFEMKNNLFNEIDCIHYMVNTMVNAKYVEASFQDEIIKREQLSSTAFGYFAIPHSMKMNAYKTGINVIISNKPILWHEKPVHLVLMMCFNKNQRYIFNKIYEMITTILSENDNVKKIMKCQTYDTFIDTMVSLL